MVVQSVEGLKLQIKEDNLKMQELLLEQKNIAKDIRKQNKEIEKIDAELTP